MTATGRSPGARRLAELAAYATGAISAAGAVGVGVLIGQALLARLTIPGAQAPPPRCDGLYGGRYHDVTGASTLRLAVLGDSTAAGYGAPTAATHGEEKNEKLIGAPVNPVPWNSVARGATIGIHGRSAATCSWACTTRRARAASSGVP